MSRKQVALTLAVVALVAVAGCMGGSSGSASTTTSTTTATETTTAQTTTTTSSSKSLSSITLPTGITESKVSELKLLQAHGKSLEGLAFKSAVNVEIVSAAESDNPKTLTQSLKVTADLKAKTALAVTSFDGDKSRIKYMGDGKVYTKSIGTDGAASYTVNDRSLRTTELTGAYLYAKFLQGLNFEPAKTVTQDGQTYIKLNVTGFDDKQVVANELKASTVNAPKGTALVTPSGRIHSMHFTIPYSPEKSDTKGKLSVSISSSTSGDISVSKPSWTKKAAEQSLDVNVTLQDQSYVAITPKNGKIPEGSTFHVYTEPTGTAKLTVQSTVKAGDTIYLYVKDGAAKLSTEKPTGTTTIKAYSMAAVGPDGNELFRANE